MSRNVDEYLDAEASLNSLSAATHQEVEAEIRRILEESEREASRALVAHRDSLDLLAATLESEETLEGDQLAAILAAVSPEVELFGSLPRSGDNHAAAGVADAFHPGPGST
jgi:cell division protease FtsH